MRTLKLTLKILVDDVSSVLVILFNLKLAVVSVFFIYGDFAYVSGGLLAQLLSIGKIVE